MKFSAYLRNSEMTDGQFAKKARIPIYTIRKYKYGTRIPRPKNMLRIKKATNNAVCEADWYK